eukprot:COSAG06_NODE_3362_length_5453_cov_5.741688_9_plen_127_part_00
MQDGEKTVFLSHLCIKTIFLPRQARDKHRESTPKQTVLSGAAANSAASELAGKDGGGGGSEEEQVTAKFTEALARFREAQGLFEGAREHVTESVEIDTALENAGEKRSHSFFECFPYVCPEPVLVK